MASEYELVNFGDVCEYSAFGPRFSSKEYASDGNVACLRTMDMDFSGRINFDAMPLANLDLSRLKTHILRRGDLVITRTGAYLGKAAVFSDFRLPVVAGAFSIYFRLKREIADPLFVRYFFNSSRGQAVTQSISTGSAQPNLNIPNLHSLLIPLPSLSEQHAITSVLAPLDDKIELNRRMNETLESMARALFKSWFVDFDPVIDNALAAGSSIPEPLAARASARAALGDQRKPLPKNIRTLFPASFTFHEEMGWIPKGWEVSALEDLCETITDGAHRSPPSVDDGLPMASVKDMHNWGFTLDGCRRISEAEFAKLIDSGCQPKRGDVLLAKDGAKCLETVCEFQQKDELVLLSSVAIFRPSLRAVSPFLHIWFGLGSTQFYLKEGFVSGSAIPRAVLRDLKKARFVTPTEQLFEAFADSVNPTRNRVRQAMEQSEALKATRDTLLPKLLSGELRIPDAEKLVADSV